MRKGRTHGHWKASTFVSRSILRDIIAPFVLDCPINRTALETYVEKVLVPELRAHDIAIIDTSPATRGGGH